MNEHEEIRLFKEVTELSLKNAEQWAKDARLLLNASSHKHAQVLMQFAREETAKFLVCWHVSEGIWPAKDNALVKEAFRSHKIKIHILFGFIANLIQGEPLRDSFRAKDYRREIKYIEAHPLFKNLAFYSDKLRQITTHVSIDWKNGKILNPERMDDHTRLQVSYEAAVSNLQGLEHVIKYMRKIHEGNISEQDKNRLRDFYKHFPKEAWKTGEVPIEWVEKISEEGVKP